MAAVRADVAIPPIADRKQARKEQLAAGRRIMMKNQEMMNLAMRARARA